MAYDIQDYDQTGLSDTMKKCQLQHLTDKHRALMRKLLVGKTMEQAAEEVGFSPKWASICARSPLFKKEFNRMKETLEKELIEAQVKKEVGDLTRRELNDSTLKAAQKLREALDADDMQAVIRAAANILDRTGYGKEENIKASILVEPSPGLLNALSRVVEIEGEEVVAEIVDDNPKQITG